MTKPSFISACLDVSILVFLRGAVELLTRMGNRGSVDTGKRGVRLGQVSVIVRREKGRTFALTVLSIAGPNLLHRPSAIRPSVPAPATWLPHISFACPLIDSLSILVHSCHSLYFYQCCRINSARKSLKSKIGKISWSVTINIFKSHQTSHSGLSRSERSDMKLSTKNENVDVNFVLF